MSRRSSCAPARCQRRTRIRSRCPRDQLLRADSRRCTTVASQEVRAERASLERRRLSLRILDPTIGNFEMAGPRLKSRHRQHTTTLMGKCRRKCSRASRYHCCAGNIRTRNRCRLNNVLQSRQCRGKASTVQCGSTPASQPRYTRSRTRSRPGIGTNRRMRLRQNPASAQSRNTRRSAGPARSTERS